MANCDSVSKASLAEIKLESIIDETIFSSGAVVVMVADTNLCLKDQTEIIINENSITASAELTGKCDMTGFDYLNSSLDLTFEDGTNIQVVDENSNIIVDSNYKIEF